MKYRWSQLVLILSCGKELKRSIEIEQKYLDYKIEIMEKGLTIEDIVFGDYLKKNFYAFHLNKFPYNVDEKIKHHVLWFHPNFEYTKNLIQKIINFHIDTKKNKIFFFQNKIKYQSVRDIPHIHVFSTLK